MEASPHAPGFPELRRVCSGAFELAGLVGVVAGLIVWMSPGHDPLSAFATPARAAASQLDPRRPKNREVLRDLQVDLAADLDAARLRLAEVRQAPADAVEGLIPVVER